MNKYALIIGVFLLIFTSLLNRTQGQDAELAELYVCPPCNSNCDKLTFSEAGNCSHCNMELIKESELKRFNQDSKKRIAFYLQSGIEVLDFAGPMEVFSYAGYEVFTVSEKKEIIISQGILKVQPDFSVEDAPEADILAFFGGNAWPTLREPAVQNWIKNQKEVETYFSVCKGAFALAESGLLDGKTATTFHNALESLEENYPRIDVRKDVRFVDNGKVITTAGISAGIDGALHLVAKLEGVNKAREIAYHMEYDKWLAGEGLILSPDNPYEGLLSLSELSDYEGKYQYLAGSEIEIFADKEERGLFARVEGMNYPLFQDEKDQFRNLQGDLIIFKRDGSGKVSSYSLATENDSYKKLD